MNFVMNIFHIYVIVIKDLQLWKLISKLINISKCIKIVQKYYRYKMDISNLLKILKKFLVLVEWKNIHNFISVFSYNIF